MVRERDYRLTKQADGGFRLNRTTEPFPGTVAFIKTTVTRSGEQCGWRLKGRTCTIYSRASSANGCSPSPG
jgi:hypothetical protein